MIFLAWMTFFDQYDLKSIFKYRSELKEIEASKKYYQQEIQSLEKEVESLESDQKAIEKFAREKYLMKRENEEIFILEE